MIPELVPIVLQLVSACILDVTYLFDRLGAVPYMVALGIFLAFMRFIVLPLLDHGSSVPGLEYEIRERTPRPEGNQLLLPSSSSSSHSG